MRDNKEYLLKEWDYEKNILKPDEITYGSNKRIHWKCEEGHTWTATAGQRTRGSNCPKCIGVGTSYSEQYLYQMLKDRITYKRHPVGCSTKCLTLSIIKESLR